MEYKIRCFTKGSRAFVQHHTVCIRMQYIEFDIFIRQWKSNYTIAIYLFLFRFTSSLTFFYRIHSFFLVCFVRGHLFKYVTSSLHTKQNVKSFPFKLEFRNQNWKLIYFRFLSWVVSLTSIWMIRYEFPKLLGMGEKINNKIHRKILSWLMLNGIQIFRKNFPSFTPFVVLLCDFVSFRM